MLGQKAQAMEDRALGAEDQVLELSQSYTQISDEHKNLKYHAAIVLAKFPFHFSFQIFIFWYKNNFDR